jgi:hypothetical protein
MKIGGWAALISIVAIPLEIAALLVAPGPVDAPLASPPVVAAEALRAIGILVAAIALSGWLRELSPRFGPIATVIGVVGSGIGLAADAAQMLNLPSSAFDALVFLVANGGIGCWFILAGWIIERNGDRLRRVGSVGQLGGAGVLLATAVVGGLPVHAGGGPWLQYSQILSPFGILFLVRLWQAVTFDRLPAPGRI